MSHHMQQTGNIHEVFMKTQCRDVLIWQVFHHLACCPHQIVLVSRHVASGKEYLGTSNGGGTNTSHGGV